MQEQGKEKGRRKKVIPGEISRDFLEEMSLDFSLEG